MASNRANKQAAAADAAQPAAADAAQPAAAEPAAQPATPDYAAQLEQLKGLQAQGLISEEEYEDKKRQILGL